MLLVTTALLPVSFVVRWYTILPVEKAEVITTCDSQNTLICDLHHNRYFVFWLVNCLLPSDQLDFNEHRDCPFIGSMYT
jgi:hypothetical protein